MSLSYVERKYDQLEIMDNKNITILTVEDDELQKLALKQVLQPLGEILEASSKEEALNKLRGSHLIDLVFIDLDLIDGPLKGLDLIQPSLETGAYTVVLSGRDDEKTIRKAYELSCHDYLVKPFAQKSLKLILDRYRLFKEKDELKDSLIKSYITNDFDMMSSLSKIKEISLSEGPILLEGATGTGKSFLAKLIHNLLFKNEEKFIEINCSEVPESLIESELFGYEKGAFSGADKSKKGKLLLADGGTLFLDEIATMPAVLQKKLLKAIDEKKFYPLGSEKPVYSNFRLISATCEDIKSEVLAKRFREDLYFRIDGLKIKLKPLKNRKNDINLLINHFVNENVRRIVFTNAAKEKLLDYTWPGNIRELKKLIKRLSLEVKGLFDIQDLPEYIQENYHPCESEKIDTVSSVILSKEEKIQIERNGLRQFTQSIEERVVSHYHLSNNKKVKNTLSQLKISNSAFYKIMNRIRMQLS